MRKLLSATLAIVMFSACGGSSPTAPAPPITPPAPTLVTITGRVTAINGGQALAGVSAELGATTAATATDGSGTFRTQLLPTATTSLQLTGSLIVPRTLMIAALASRDVAVSAIALGGSFDLNFYRQFVRDGFDAPGVNRPLRRWTKAPSIYLRTVDDAGVAIDAKTLDSTEAAIRESVPIWTAGTYSVAALERGTDTRERQPGWVTVLWHADAAAGKCGSADVAVEGGTVNLYPRVPNCRCAGVSEVRPRTVRHELGHAMGYWHTDNVSDLMSIGLFSGCDQQPSARERSHAAIAYQRPVGNVDPDTDPSGAVTLAPLRAIP